MTSDKIDYKRLKPFMHWTSGQEVMQLPIRTGVNHKL